MEFVLKNLNPSPKKIFYEGKNIEYNGSKIKICCNDFEDFFSNDCFVLVDKPEKADLTVKGIISSSVKELEDFLNKNDFELSLEDLSEEGYLLKIHEDKKEISIGSSTKRGFFYASQTLKQLIDTKNNSLPIVEIIDFSSFKLRGIIEGFYGKPWSDENRIDIIRFCGKNKMNAYWYAPKDDPYHREKWREPYPSEEKKKIYDLIEEAKKNYVDFVFCISPGLSMKFSEEIEFSLLCNKYDEVLSWGVTNVAILFDDISHKLEYEEDVRKFNNNYGLAQAYIANKLYDFLKKKDSKTKLYFCPTEYWQKEDSPYRRTLKDNLNPEILVIWTGNGVWSKRVSRKNANEISNQFGHKLVLWDNYPVNDADEGKLFLGPLTNREVDLYKSIEGVIANPMNQAYASLIALQTISDYLWNSESYNPWTSWEKAIFNIAGENFSRELELFSENFLKSRLFEGTSFKLKRLLKNYKEDSLNASKELVSYLEELSNLDEELSKIGFKGFYEDIKPWVAKLSELSRIVIKLITSPESEKDLIKREGEIRIKEYENISVCDDILDIFIKEI